MYYLGRENVGYMWGLFPKFLYINLITKNAGTLCETWIKTDHSDLQRFHLNTVKRYRHIQCLNWLTWLLQIYTDFDACETSAGMEAHLPPSLSPQLAFKNCRQWLFNFGSKCLSCSCLTNDFSCSTVLVLLFDIFSCHNVHYICICRLL